MSFDYIRNIRSRHTVACTKEIMQAAMRSTIVTSTCAEIADIREMKLRGEMSREDFDAKKTELKKRLPAFCFHAHFKNGRRLNADAIPSGLSIYDLDHIADPRGRWAAIAPRAKELGIVLAHVSPSCEGLRLVFVLPEGKDLAEGQRWLAGQLGDKEFDEACKDLARCSFAVPEDYILYVNHDELFKGRNCGDNGCGDDDCGDDDCGDAAKADSNCGDAALGVGQPKNSAATCDAEGGVATNGGGGQPKKSHRFAATCDAGGGVATNEGVATNGGVATNEGGATKASEESLRIFDEVLSASGLTADNLNNVGTRHNSLITILSMGICRLMPIDQLQAVVAERMPNYSKEKDCQDLIRDFYEKYTDPNRPMSVKLRKIYTDSLKHRGSLCGDAALGVGKVGKAGQVGQAGKVGQIGQSSGKAGLDAEGGVATNEDIDPDSAGAALVAARTLQKKIIRRLPGGLKESVDGVPTNMQMPVLCSVLPLAAAYADGVTVRYCDGATQRLGLMSIIVGPQASGKSACKKKVDLWERQMKDEDARAREIEDQWKEAKKSRKANEKAPEDPMVLIRSVPATISCSTLLRRFKNSRGHCLWTFCEELDTLRKTNGAGSWSSKYDIYRLGFDYGEWGQDYNSDQAVSGVVNVAYNFSILGTYGAMRKCFHGDNVENGLSSRIIIAEMPDSAFAPMPTYGQPTTDASAAIDKAVTLLRSQTGFVDTPRLRKAIGEWVEKKRLEAMADGDLVKDTYRKRAAVIGFRCGVVARLLTGKETNAVLDFATLMAQYVLDEQLKIFGESLRAEYKKASDEQQRSSSNQSVFDQLPPVFTLQDLQQLKGPDTTRNAMQMIISRWKHSDWIKKVGVNRWQKQKTNN